MKNLGKTVRIAQIEGKPWKQALNQFLRSYRAAPHGSTNVSPNQLMFGRNLSSRLPSAETQERTPQLETALVNYELMAEKNRKYADRKLSTKPSPLKAGDTVLVKAEKKNKLSPLYKPEKHTVMVRDNSWVVTKSNVTGKKVTRNISMLKLLPDVIVEDSVNDEPEVIAEQVVDLVRFGIRRV